MTYQGKFIRKCTECDELYTILIFDDHSEIIGSCDHVTKTEAPEKVKAEASQRTA